MLCYIGLQMITHFDICGFMGFLEQSSAAENSPSDVQRDFMTCPKSYCWQIGQELNPGDPRHNFAITACGVRDGLFQLFICRTGHCTQMLKNL